MKYFILTIMMLAGVAVQAQHYYLYTGTYTTGESKGIYIFDFNASSGKITPLGFADGIENPSYIAVSSDGRYLYAVNETGGEKPGSLSSFAIDKKTGNLRLLNNQPTGGDHPCYVDVDKKGNFVVAGNYSGGNLSVFKSTEGRLSPYVQLIQHTGSGENKMRQEKAHVHSTRISPDQKFLFVPDLGIDKVMVYPFNASASTPIDESAGFAAEVSPGAGPRHISFHPNRKWIYLMEEMSGNVSAFEFSNGQMKNIQTVSAHPDDYTDTKGSADIHVSSDGKFLYASNRAASNTIAIFSIDPSTGKLTTKGFQSTLGNTPRNFALDPTNNYLLVANQQSNNIVVFKRDKKTGLLSETGTIIDVPSPVCLKFLKK